MVTVYGNGDGRQRANGDGIRNGNGNGIGHIIGNDGKGNCPKR